MIKKCLGCGINLQDKNKDEAGFIDDLNKDLCLRCFKLKHYNVLTNNGISIDNEYILRMINGEGCFTLFLVDLFSINSKVIETYKRIKNSKILVLTKADLIPKNIKFNQLIDNIKKVYDISEDVLIVSTKMKNNMRTLENLLLSKKKVILAGFTNAGKSSLINTLVDASLTVSKKLNTTQDFISINTDDYRIIDAPGFIDESVSSMVPRSIIKPKSIQGKKGYVYHIGNVILSLDEDANFTAFVSDEANIFSKKETESLKKEIVIPKDSDLLLKNIGFLRFKNEAHVYLNIGDFEIRKSLIGDIDE